MSSFNSPTIAVTVFPRHSSDDGVFSIFIEISKIEPGVPQLELQQVRALAWELNLIPTSVFTKNLFNNIFTILFYSQSCKRTMKIMEDQPSGLPEDSSFMKTQNEKFTPPPQKNNITRYNNDIIELLMNVNLLKSCARDHLAKVVSNYAIFHEIEVLEVVSSLSIILNAPEFISFNTFTRIYKALHNAHLRFLTMWMIEVHIRKEVSLLKVFF